MLKTKAYLKSRFETGDVPTGEDYENLIDSFWHKSELGQVASGDARPVTGGAVFAAINSLIDPDVIKALVAAKLEEILPAILANYVTSTALATAMSGNATQAWVNQQLGNYATTVAVNTALGSKANIADVYTKTAADELLANKAAISELPDLSGYATKEELPDITGLASKSELPDISGLATKTEMNTALSGKQATISDLDTIRSGAAAGATAYQKPSGGIPASDMVVAVQTSLGKADSAYQKPSGGIPKTDLVDSVQTSLGKADSAIQSHQSLSTYALKSELPDISGLATKTEMNTALSGKQATISDLDTIRRGAAAGATAYQKPSGGIPASDMVVAVQTSLGKADSAYQKPSGGIPTSDMASNLTQIVNNMQTQVQSATASASAAAASAASAASVPNSNLINRVGALETKVDGDGNTTGLLTRASNLENKVGNIPDKVDISTDLKETREKTNDVITELKKNAEIAELLKDVGLLDIAVAQ